MTPLVVSWSVVMGCVSPMMSSVMAYHTVAMALMKLDVSSQYVESVLLHIVCCISLGLNQANNVSFIVVLSYLLD